MKLCRNTLLPIGAVIAASCYSYTPVESPQPGMEVRAQLTTEAAVRRSEGLTEPILHYDGVVVDTSPDTVALDVLVARSITPFQEIEMRDTVQLATGEVASMMRRRISPGRTALLTVGIAAGAVAMVASIDAVVGGTGDGGDGGPPPAIVVPVFGWNGSRLLPSVFPIGR